MASNEPIVKKEDLLKFTSEAHCAKCLSKQLKRKHFQFSTPGRDVFDCLEYKCTDCGYVFYSQSADAEKSKS